MQHLHIYYNNLFYIQGDPFECPQTFQKCSNLCSMQKNIESYFYFYYNIISVFYFFESLHSILFHIS